MLRDSEGSVRYAVGWQRRGRFRVECRPELSGTRPFRIRTIPAKRMRALHSEVTQGSARAHFERRHTLPHRIAKNPRTTNRQTISGLVAPPGNTAQSRAEHRFACAPLTLARLSRCRDQEKSGRLLGVKKRAVPKK